MSINNVYNVYIYIYIHLEILCLKIDCIETRALNHPNSEKDNKKTNCKVPEPAELAVGLIV